MDTPITITITGDSVSLTTPEGKEVSMPIGKLAELLVPEPSTPGVLPPGVRLVQAAGSTTIWVYEIPPSVRQFKWISNDSPAQHGPGTKYRTVRLSLPYVVVFAVFQNGILMHSNECFFRVEPITDEAADKLHYPALLNCSRFRPANRKPLSWICTQHLDPSTVAGESDPKRRMVLGLTLLHRCLLETGFNLSSEAHEYSSWFTESRKIDPRVATVEAWEKATGENPSFVYEVPWLETGKTVAEVVERIFKLTNTRRRTVRSSTDLYRMIINHASKG